MYRFVIESIFKIVMCNMVYSVLMMGIPERRLYIQLGDHKPLYRSLVTIQIPLFLA